MTKTISQLYTDNPITVDTDTLVEGVGDPGGSPASGAFKLSQLMLNRYRVVVSVNSNNLTVALKHLDGTSDPSTNKPLYFKIGNSVRSVTSALSITINAGTNWFASGDAQLATQLVPYFVYVLYDSNSSAVALTIGRKPYFRLVSETSATTTNESHIYGYSGFKSTDEMENIGYFEATLSATPGFTWTVPTFTNSNLKNYPVYETRDFTFVPQWTNLTVGNGTLTASYKICYRTVMGAVYMLLGNTSSVGSVVSHTIPFSTQLADTHPVGILRILDASASVAFSGLVQITSGVMALRALNIVSTYLAGANLSSTVPMTWTTSDLITHTFAYPM